MEKVTERFEIGLKQEEIDFVDVNLESDALLFLNPTLFGELTDIDFSKKVSHNVYNFFETVLNFYSTNRKKEAIKLFNHSGETNAVHLGYSRTNKGKGTSERALTKLFDTVLASKVLENKVLSNPISLVLFVEDFAEDRMSDLIISILKKELVEYTLEQAILYQIPIENDEINYGKYWDVSSRSWKTLKNKYIKDQKGKPIILVPKQIISKKFGFSAKNYLSKVIFEWRQAKHSEELSNLCEIKRDKTGNIIKVKPPSHTTLRKIEIDKVYGVERGKTKKYIMDKTLDNPGLLDQFFEQHTDEAVKRNGNILSDQEITSIIEETEFNNNANEVLIGE